MRYFLGFDLDAKSKLQIEAWRDKALPSFERAVPARNFHITSVFLGPVSSSQLDSLCRSIDAISISAFSVKLDMMGFFAKPKALWLGCNQPPESLLHTNRLLAEQARKAGLMIPHKEQIPHMTLARKVAFNPPAPLIQPEFPIALSHVHLFESVSSEHGVHYPIRESWPMVPNFHHR